MAIFLFNVILWRDSMQMRQISNLKMFLMGCANRAMAAIRRIFFVNRCLCISHIGADCMFGLKRDQYLLCILQQYFDSWRHFSPVLWTI